MFPTLGNTSASLVIIVDAPFGLDLKQRRLLSASLHTPLPVALHKNGLGLHEAFVMSVLPYHMQDSEDYITTVKKTGGERGWNPVEGGFVCDTLLHRRRELLQTLDAIGPTAVLVMGDLALWTLTGEWKAHVMRGSICPSVPSPSGRVYKCISTISTVALNLQPELRKFFDRDVKRAVVETGRPGGFKWPEWNFLVQAPFETYVDKLKELIATLDKQEIQLAADIETVRRQIACIGIAWSPLDAICVPFRTSREYWTVDQEIVLIKLLALVLEHPNAKVIWQNGHYDVQYLAVKWGTIPRTTDDTMIAQHILYPGMKKSLDAIASLHCDFYHFWKDELDDYKNAPKDDHKFFSYNCRDCCYTWEAMQSLREEVAESPGNIPALYRERMDRFWWTLLRMTLRGIRVNAQGRGKLAEELMSASQARQEFLTTVIGRDFNPRSPVQMKTFFYDEMGIKPEKSRTTKKDSLNAENLIKIPEQRPLLHPLVDAIVEMRSLGVFLKTFALAPLDYDQRIRSFFAMAGTDTYRLASRENAFGTGANLQNIPKGDRARTALVMPNIRTFFLPDSNMELFDIDLAGADAQVVAWEADDAMLKELFRKGEKVHAHNAKDLYGHDAGPDGKREPYYTRTKMGTHLCVDAEHEALTPNGWIKVAEIDDLTPILVCEKDGTNAHFAVPTAWYRAVVADTTMVHLKGTAYDQFVTPDHKMSYVVDFTGVRETRALFLPQSARLLKTCKYSGFRHGLSTELLRMLCAFHADGSIAKKQVTFHFKKSRKITRLQLLLEVLKATYRIRKDADGTTTFFVSGDLAAWLIAKGKQPTWTMLQFSGDDLDAYLDELVFWDGHQAETSQTFCTSVKLTAEVVQTLLHLRGNSGSILTNFFQGKDRYRVQINNRPLARVEKKCIERWSGAIYCPTVSTGYWFTRRNGRMGVTGNSNYGGYPTTMAKALGITVHDAEKFQKRWFSVHPGIAKWHERVEHQLQTTRTISNRFGYTYTFLGRIDRALPQALAWGPQSTVAIVTAKAMDEIDLRFPSAEILIQVHDSIVFQIPIRRPASLIDDIILASRITIPYPDPLVIPFSVKSSTINWGVC